MKKYVLKLQNRKFFFKIVKICVIRYFLWLNQNRESIIKEYKLDKSKVAEIGKKAGELWKDVEQSVKDGFQKQVDKAKVQYEKDMAKYKASAAEAA